MVESGGDAVTLRPWRRDDAGALVAAWNDPEIAEGATPPADRSLTAARRWIDGCTEREHRLLAVDRVIEVAGRCVGEVGASEFDLRRGAALLGWWVAPAHRGQGYASGAVIQMCELLFDRFDCRALVAEIGPANEASIRVAVAAGFTLLRASDDGRPHAYARRRD